MQTNPTVFMVATDTLTKRSVEKIAAVDRLNTELFTTTDDFLTNYHIHITGCVVTDLLPEENGFELLQKIRTQPHALPIIFLSNQASVRIAVETIRQGALHFLEQPVTLPELQSTIQEAFQIDQKNQKARLELMVLHARYANLTERENQIFHLISKKHSNTRIAVELGITVKTVEFHRAHVMEKMYADSVCELLNMAETLSNNNENSLSTQIMNAGLQRS